MQNRLRSILAAILICVGLALVLMFGRMTGMFGHEVVDAALGTTAQTASSPSSPQFVTPTRPPLYTITPSPTLIRTPTATSTPTRTPTITLSPTATATPTATRTPTITLSPTATATPTPTRRPPTQVDYTVYLPLVVR